MPLRIVVILAAAAVAAAGGGVAAAYALPADPPPAKLAAMPTKLRVVAPETLAEVRPTESGPLGGVARCGSEQT